MEKVQQQEQKKLRTRRNCFLSSFTWLGKKSKFLYKYKTLNYMSPDLFFQVNWFTAPDHTSSPKRTISEP